MDRSRYPANWDAIAQAVKAEANWHCEDCKRPCRKPGADRFDFEEWLVAEHPDWGADLYEEVETEEFRNLKALCAPCHCRMDLAAMATKKRLKAERLGQLNLGV